MPERGKKRCKVGMPETGKNKLTLLCRIIPEPVNGLRKQKTCYQYSIAYMTMDMCALPRKDARNTYQIQKRIEMQIQTQEHRQYFLSQELASENKPIQTQK